MVESFHARAGQHKARRPIRLQFSVATDASYLTAFRIDGVDLK
jgi:hypothetical protein